MSGPSEDPLSESVIVLPRETIAEFCQRWQMEYQEYVGSDDYFKAFIDSIDAPEEAGSEFVLVPPGGEIAMEQFFRS